MTLAWSRDVLAALHLETAKDSYVNPEVALRELLP